MNFGKIIKFFIPNDTSFFPLFEEAAQMLVKTADLLHDMMLNDSPEIRKNNIKQIKNLEVAADDVAHNIFENLNKIFITPFDREDIHALTSSLDDVIDSINGVSQRIELYNPKSFLPEFERITQLIVYASKEILSAITALKNLKNPEKIKESCIKINSFENQADDLYHSAVSALFQNETDPFELIKKKEILETLEKIADKAEDVSDVLKTIIIKAA